MKKIVYLLLLTTIIFSSCKKGNIDIENSGFWVNNCTAPFEVQFYLNVHYQPKEISYHWDFGDGNTSSDKEPNHIYAETGVYNVKLQIVNYKQTIEKTYSINISQDPMPIEAEFDYQSKHRKYFAPTEIEFINNSQYATNFFWNFGDGNGSEETSPTHIFDTAGTYNIYLHAICNNDTATSLFQLEIAPPPETISVDVVSIWLPEQYLGGLFELHYYIQDNY
ncbi:MAG: PKD domain-containing protein, partial [Bacteroidota bacterium]|nr:PKD domain-containing protein [Bacteroidota bacterium]